MLWLIPVGLGLLLAACSSRDDSQEDGSPDSGRDGGRDALQPDGELDVSTPDTGDGGYVPPFMVERVSVSSGGIQGNAQSDRPSMNAAGRFVAFDSYASNLVTGDTNGYQDIFVRDRLMGTTERINVSSGGVQANNNSGQAVISADGRFVVFTSAASNLVSGDTNGFRDVFVRDRQAGTTERVSIGTGGVEANGQSGGSGESGHWVYRPVDISADGRFVVFTSTASNLVLDDTNGVEDVFIRDRQNGITERVSVGSGGFEGNGLVLPQVSISADGRFVSFSSTASNLVSEDTNWARDIFVRDRQTGITERLSVSSTGIEGNRESRFPSISSNGRFVAFHSDSTNLISGVANGRRHVFVRDRESNSLVLASSGLGGVPGNLDSNRLSISGDGRFITFESYAFNLVPTGADVVQQNIFVRDLLMGVTQMVSVGPTGGKSGGSNYTPVISSDGRFVAFQTYADNLVRNDTNNQADIFVVALEGFFGRQE